MLLAVIVRQKRIQPLSIIKFRMRPTNAHDGLSKYLIVRVYGMGKRYIVLVFAVFILRKTITVSQEGCSHMLYQPYSAENEEELKMVRNKFIQKIMM